MRRKDHLIKAALACIIVFIILFLIETIGEQETEIENLRAQLEQTVAADDKLIIRYVNESANQKVIIRNQKETIARLEKDLESVSNYIIDTVVLNQEEISNQQIIIDSQETKIASLEHELRTTNNQLREIQVQHQEQPSDAIPEEAKSSEKNIAVVNTSNKEKYNYILYNELGKETDMGKYLDYAVNLCNEKGICPDMLFSIIKLESGGYETVKNKNSTATGFCQLIEGTGRSMYKRLGYKETYNHSVMAKNGKLNIEMGVELLSYLMDKNNGDVKKVIAGYAGSTSDRYWTRFKNQFDQSSSTLDDIKNMYNSHKEDENV